MINPEVEPHQVAVAMVVAVVAAVVVDAAQLRGPVPVVRRR